MAIGVYESLGQNTYRRSLQTEGWEDASMESSSHDAMNLNLLNTFDAGQSYTEAEHRDWSSASGFVDIERAKFLLPDGHGLIAARIRV